MQANGGSAREGKGIAGERHKEGRAGTEEAVDEVN